MFGSKQPPLLTIIKNETTGLLQYEGTTYSMVVVLATKMNFTPDFVADADSITLGRKTDKGWTGMIDKIIKKEVDIAANGYWRTMDRMKDVYFTFPFDLEEMSMMIQKTTEDHKYLFLTPFTWDVSFMSSSSEVNQLS